MVEISRITSHCFKCRDLLLQSLTHSSYSNERYALNPGSKPCPNNERLEFLGDAVIGLLIGERLMELFPDASEGKLSRWRSNLVSRKTLAEIAGGLKLGEIVFLGRGERQTGGMEKRSILAAVFESLVGALYLDGGIECCRQFMNSVYSSFFLQLEKGDDALIKLTDKKTHLQEKTQSLYKVAPLYRLVEAWGPEHEKVFRVEIVIEGRVIARGDGRSKKEAEQEAASIALEILGI